MLVTCPECELQVSDKAMICPHCGFPLKESKTRNTYRKTNKRKKLPNGFGRITELKNRNLRKPFRVMITVEKDKLNKPIGKTLGYYETYNDAYAALVDYNKNPYDLNNDITAQELYKRWSDHYYKDVSSGRAKNLELAWKYSSTLYSYKVKEIRARHIKNIMTDGMYKNKKPSVNTSILIKTLWNLLLDYAVEYEIVDRNYARSFNTPKDIAKAANTAEKEHITFSKDEMKNLWNHVNTPYVDIVLIQCYSGWRPQELGLILLKDVDIEQWTFTGGIKSDAGKCRTVPIHPKIRPLVKTWYDRAIKNNSKYLFFYNNDNNSKSKLTYDKYYDIYTSIVNALNLNPEHRPHDPRKQFVSMAKESGVDSYAVKIFVGHTLNNDVTEKVYTKVSLEWMQTEMKKIKDM